MRFFDFIFLKRNDWAHDRRAIEENLGRVKEKDPLWLVVFPEGTVVSKETRERSVKFAKKAGLVRFCVSVLEERRMSLDRRIIHEHC